MRLPYVSALLVVYLSGLPLHKVSAEELKGAARREYEKATSDGSLSTSCGAKAAYFVFWAGKAPSVLNVDGKDQAVQFEPHKVGDYIKKPYQCRTAEGLLTITTRLTHTVTNSQCGAGNNFIVKLSMSHLGSYSDSFLVDGCGGTSGLLERGKHVLLCQMRDEDPSGVGRCVEAADAARPRELR